jgi:hypothetical protein
MVGLPRSPHSLTLVGPRPHHFGCDRVKSMVGLPRILYSSPDDVTRIDLRIEDGTVNPQRRGRSVEYR